MPRYYCDYCDTYLTHDSPSVRKQHNAGYKHKANVRTYYQQFEEQQTQSFIDQKIKEHLGQTAFQVGASFNQYMQANPQAPRLPMLRPPIMPMGQMPPYGVRPPMLPPPIAGIPGYAQAPTTMGPPGATMGMQNMMMPPNMNSAPNGAASNPASSGIANTSINPAMYQTNPSFAPSSSAPPANAQTSENDH